MIGQDDRDWEALRRRLEPIEGGVPATIPPWQVAALGLAQLGAVIAAALVVLPLVTWLTGLLDGPLGATARPFALGAAVFVWAMLSLAALDLLARRVSRGALGVARRDWLFAAVLYLALAGWVVGLGLWQVSILGELAVDASGWSARPWPMAVLAASLLLSALPMTGSRLRVRLWAAAAGIWVVLIAFAAVDLLGALADGHVSAAGLAVGIDGAVQLVVLLVWIERGRPGARGSV
jgi:hypothetical protein